MRYIVVFFLLIPLPSFGQTITEHRVYFVNSTEAVVITDTAQALSVIDSPGVGFGVFVMSASDKWSEIKYSDGKIYQGYILNEYLSPNQKQAYNGGSSVVREVDDFTGVITIKPIVPMSLHFVNTRTLTGSFNLYWQSDIGYYFLLSTSSDDWVFLETVDRNNATMYVIADNERMRLENGYFVDNDVNSGYVFEQYAWQPTESKIQKLVNAETLRMKLGTVEFPEVSSKLKELWREVYNTGQNEAK